MSQGQPPRHRAMPCLDTATFVLVEGEQPLEQLAGGRADDLLDTRCGDAWWNDQREVELLVQAGFTPIDAIKIATSNGAQYMGILDKTGTIAVGKSADLVLIHGDPTANIEDIEKVETVFKDGVGFDSAKLIESVRGQVGIR